MILALEDRTAPGLPETQFLERVGAGKTSKCSPEVRGRAVRVVF
jgi:hypothetical protein